MDAVADGLLPAEQAGELVLLVAAWVDPGTTRRDGGAAGEPRGDCRRDPRRARDRPGGARPASWSTCATARATPSTAASEVRIELGRDPHLPLSRSTRRSRRRGIPVPATRRRRRWSSCAPTTARSATRAAATGCPTRRCSTGCCAASTRADAERVRGICETVDFHGGRPWAVEVACWDLVGRALGEPLWRLLGGRRERLARVRLERRAAGAGRARAGASAQLRDARRAGDQAALPPRRLARRRRGRRGRARRRRARRSSIMVDANQGWRMPGDRTPRWDVATAAACARALERARRVLARGAAADRRRRRLRARCGGGRRCGSRPARWCARRTRRATWCSAAAST